jgi:hypothetical protein
MAKDFPLSDVTSAAGQAAEALIIQLLRTQYPTLDLRRGTVLRELLVRPAAALDAREIDRYDYLQLIRSLQLIAENPADATTDDVNALLSNYQMTMRDGAQAHGRVRISVSVPQSIVVGENIRLTTVNGVALQPDSTYTVLVTNTPEPGQLPLFTSADGTYYYFLLPMSAVVAGQTGNLEEGTALDLTSGSINNFVTATTYETFVGGVDPETVQQLIDRMPAAVSHRTLDSAASIEAMLRSEEGGNFTELQALSTQGFGDAGQLRDKHNAHGVAMGGKVDVYPRMFFQPVIATLLKTGTRVAANTYRIEIAAADAPGYYAIRMVADAESVFAPGFSFGTIVAEGGYVFTETRTAVGLQNTWHDIRNVGAETVGTVYQAAALVVSGVPDTAETHQFKVEFYVNPRMTELQAFVDSPDYRNLKADYLVRCPFMCLVSVRATLYARNPAAIDVSAVTNRVRDYINSKSFTAKLTNSEIISVLHEFDIERVNLTADPIVGLQVYGTVRDTDGVEHTMGPDGIDLEQIKNPNTMMLPMTTVFATEPRNLFFTVRATV